MDITEQAWFTHEIIFNIHDDFSLREGQELIFKN